MEREQKPRMQRSVDSRTPFIVGNWLVTSTHGTTLSFEQVDVGLPQTPVDFKPVLTTAVDRARRRRA